MSEAHNKKMRTLLNLLVEMSGGRKMKRLTSSNTPDSSELYHAFVAVNGSADFGLDCEAATDGDTPNANDTIQQGATRFVELGKVDISSGTVYAYYR